MAEKVSGGPMDAGRFAALADAYGSALHRWPPAEQAAAMLFAETERGRAILARAGRLDAMLDRHRVEAASPGLHRAIVARAATEVSQKRRRRFWWLGFGLAGVGVAGAVAGLALVTVVSPDIQADHYVMDANTTSFGDAGPDADQAEEDL
ncbi:hypothetical protein [Mesorhizobium sp.]|uniref:hypothetical protein n=1 Tax=Mesorhizobium sp. TaxID=1871066 RepID=UPI000FE36801|nr:hypothetical protein [Mesorhizobium sp.]RWH71937.1 MAG: hypothetical protein EOQ84_12825 [Mesorhizobium sp.]RWL32944.1 MAG: hypothetical protein EOR58_03520 [Mesorhizobium sp.]RWL33951.1 MAG: hypothetical protein EOR63_08300 [Mesorhizobium sp.]RWL40044.1 MAG: hypothetical protein EOR59_06005 [Mesorhizobium sp.]RWL57995.1 MAG: hypothetical protein EOR62_03870 [Mesorhizobium sp.]